MPDAAQVDGGDVQIGDNFLDGEQLQDVGASVQQLAVAFLGRQAEHVEVAGIYVQKQLLDGDATRTLIFHVALIQQVQFVGGAQVYPTGGERLDVGFRRYAVQTRRIVGDKLAWKYNAYVVFASFTTVHGSVLEDTRLHKTDACRHFAFTQEKILFGE